MTDKNKKESPASILTSMAKKEKRRVRFSLELNGEESVWAATNVYKFIVRPSDSVVDVEKRLLRKAKLESLFIRIVSWEFFKKGVWKQEFFNFVR